MKTYFTEENLSSVGAGSNLDCKVLATQARGTEVDPQHPCKKLGVVACCFNLSTEEVGRENDP